MKPAVRRFVASFIAALATVSAVSVAASAANAGTPASHVSISDRAATTHQPVVDNYVHAVANRLNVMPEVAYTKYMLNLPIEDPAREKVVIDSFVERATAAGVSADLATAVIKDQLTAGKEVQYRLIMQWKSGAAELPKHAPLDLKTDIRPLIDNATDQLLGQLLAVWPHVHSSDWVGQLTIAAQRADSVLQPNVLPLELRHALQSLR